MLSLLRHDFHYAYCSDVSLPPCQLMMPLLLSMLISYLRLPPLFTIFRSCRYYRYYDTLPLYYAAALPLRAD